jgi:phage FluMu protein Com
MHGGKCPKCESVMFSVYVQPVEAKVPFGNDAYKAASYQCPTCRTVLSVQMDPLALEADLVNKIAKRLGR